MVGTKTFHGSSNSGKTMFHLNVEAAGRETKKFIGILKQQVREQKISLDYSEI